VLKRALIILLLIIPAMTAPKYRAVIHLAGDSTMADKPVDDNPERGWGQLLPLFFQPDIKIVNYARNGRSTKSFIDLGHWEQLLTNVQKGHYVFIQFGHNDQKESDTTRFAAARGAYRDNLIRMVADVRKAEGLPVLLTPVSRRKFDSRNRFVDQHGEYPDVVRELARELNVPLLDLHRNSMEKLSALGPVASEKLFLRAPAGYHASTWAGKCDNTHFNRLGAIEACRWALEEMHSARLPLTEFLSDYSGMDPEGPGKNKVVGLDHFYNRESRLHPWLKTKELFHYTWEDRENSGFWALGNLFEDRGAFLEAIETAPGDSLLARLSVYIIVDPDTPEETDTPNYLEDPAIESIVKWVENGGVLLLMANDSANCEFDSLNRLAQRFGLYFPGDRHHRVEGKRFSMGAFTELPAHPLFAGVENIYMKEISSIGTDWRTKKILKENDLVFIAEKYAGKGRVLAIGDPWLYNEYIDNRKLPEAFDNFQAANNLVDYLLTAARIVRTK